MEGQLSSGLRKMVMVVMVVWLLGEVGEVRGEMVDIKPYYSVILEQHNDLRRNVTPPAADMREMMWDETLAKDAEDWARRCRYDRPPRHVFSGGSNLFYQRRYVRSWHSVRALLLKGLQRWSKPRDYYQYSTDCGSACSYVQMIYSSTYRVGCALNTCPVMDIRGGAEEQTTLYVCFYQPRGRLTSTYPYRSGPPCSICPSGTQCSGDLCTEGAVVVSRPQGIRQPETPSRPESPYRPYQPEEVAPTPIAPQPPSMSSDALTSEESFFMLQAQNSMRQEGGCQQLEWDKKLKQWTDWIISCKVNYPGPPYTYTNFYRCPDHMPAYSMVYGWKSEGTEVAPLQRNSGCRTPFDRTKCNRYTNLMEPQVTRMACSACNCGDGTRQFVCIYENHRERYYRGYQ